MLVQISQVLSTAVPTTVHVDGVGGITCFRLASPCESLQI
jgi:hypothetical protein